MAAKKGASPAPGGAPQATRGRARPAAGSLLPEVGGSIIELHVRAAGVAMVDRLSWDDVYPLMDEVKALHPADLQVDDLSQALEREPAQVVALLDTLAELKQVQPQWAEAIEHRFYGGLTLEDAACMMAVDDCTLRRWWSGLTQCSPSGSPSC